MTSGISSYRAVLREVRKSSISPRNARNPVLRLNFRALFEKYRQRADPSFSQDIENALLFMKSQREYHGLLERYNPSINFTAEERIQATARRVGLDLPLAAKGEGVE